MAKKTNLGYVEDLIRALAIDDSDQSSDSSRAKFFSKYDEGTLSLNQRESKHYNDVLTKLADKFSKAEDISLRVIELSLQSAICYVLDIRQKRQDRTFDQRIKIAVAELVETLTRIGSKYQCYIPVSGIESQSLPFRFGHVNFLRFGNYHLRRLRDEFRHHLVSEEQMAFRKQLLADVRETPTWNSPCAKIEVTAKDSDAALALARRQVRLTLDAINFFTDLIPYNYGWLYFPEEAASMTVLSLVLSEDHSLSLPHRREGPLTGFSFRKLNETKYLRVLVRRVHQLLRNAEQRDIDQLLLSSVQWAGRATVEPRREEAFLLFAIAHESIILPSSEPRELSYRLRIRTAHLLGKTLEKRRKISKEVSDLYSLRSKIVHNGSYEITDDALARIRTLVKRVIRTVITNRDVARLEKARELDQWFEDKVLT